MMFLESIQRNQKVAVVAIAGPYRTGKSFLANRLLNQSRGFEIGSTTQACTKGIWIWNKAVPLSEDVSMLLIDTEGLVSTERSTNVDIKIFALSILLSSLFVYNQMGPITENSLEDLALVGNLTSHI
jgi:GTPase Era involved in 16S rRNA processing